MEYDNLALRELLEHIPAVVCRTKLEKGIWATQFITENISMYGYQKADFLDGRLDWLRIIHPDDRVLTLKSLRDYESNGMNEFRLYYRLMTADGKSVAVTEYYTANRDANGKVDTYDTVIISNTLSLTSSVLIDNHYKQQVILNDILLSLQDTDLGNALQIILDRTGEYLDTSRVLLFKDSEDHKTCKVVYEWDNRGISSVMDLDYSITYETGMPEIYIALQNEGKLIVDYGEIPENCKEEFEAEGLIASAIFAVYLNGSHYGFICFDDCVIERKWDEDTVRFLKNISNLISNVLVRIDVNKQLEKKQMQINRLAYTDYLTGLYNRFSCDKQLKKAIQKAEESDGKGYVLFIDMDDFKIVNDCYGHDYGDGILVSFANWLKETFPEPNQVFRFGGDEFIVVTDSCNQAPAEAIVERLQERAAKPWQALDKEFYCTLSIGVVEYPAASNDSKTIIKQADMAMYEAKRLGKNQFKIYEAGLAAGPENRTQTEMILRKAMENNFAGFRVLYQPIVDRKTNQIVAAEALLRIEADDKVVMPAEFFSLAEYLGFTIPIGEHVMKLAMEECRRINENGYPDFKICINLSNKQVKQKDVLSRFDKTVRETGVNHHNIIVSISERTTLEDSKRMQLVCEGLAQIGVEVIMDDFGGDSTTFLQLDKLPVSGITTALSLMSRIEEGHTKKFIKLLLDLCHAMNKEVCINGIETEAQYQYCQQTEAEQLQGFYLYKVLTGNDLAAQLDKNREK